MAGGYYNNKKEKCFFMFLTFKNNNSFINLVPERYKRGEYIIDRLK